MKKFVRFLVVLAISPMLLLCMGSAALIEWLSDEPNWRFFSNYFETPIKWILFK